MIRQKKGVELAFAIAAVTGSAKDSLIALGMPVHLIMKTFMMDATAGAVTNGISREDWLRDVGEEYDRCARVSSQMDKEKS